MNGLVDESRVHFAKGFKGRKRLEVGEPPAPVEPGIVPRLSRLMALAIRFERLVRTGAVRDYAELARLGYVTRARMTQVMDLLNLAPDIQEEILFLPKTSNVRDTIPERRIRAIAATPDWRRQRRMWRELNEPRLLAG
jgi:hypothetical protein